MSLEAQRGQTPVGDLLRRDGLYSTDLARMLKKVKEAALERLADRPGTKKKTVAETEYARLKKELGGEGTGDVRDGRGTGGASKKKTKRGSWER